MAKKIESMIMARGKDQSLEGEKTVTGNFLKISGREGFSAGAVCSLEPLALGTGALELAPDCTEGEFLSPVYQVSPYNDLVASWNSDTPPGTSVEVYGRAFLPEYGQWSDWISWGLWSPFAPRACHECEDSHPRRSGEPGGWVFANSYGEGGDSSLNVRDGLTATKLQLMVRLRATHDAAAQPVLRGLFATWKNTADPGWQEACVIPEAEVIPRQRVLLDTPAISQMVRDPEYARVICSAACIAMLLGGQGTDVLPEDVTLMNYDYGFGGNGNWSFSVAAAGAFGHESYVHYASFAALRQELTRGYAVGLSVKYSDSPDGKYPYLENAPTSTGGHLIIVVGYEFNEVLGEYVYFANDPAAKSDEETRREYRESQLSQAWYRRAAYYVHRKTQGAGDWGRLRESGRLLPVAGQGGEYALVTGDGEQIRLPSDFLRGKRKAFGFRGSLCLTVEGEESPLPQGARRVSANHPFAYDKAQPTAEGNVRLPEDIAERISAGDRVTLYVISSDGQMYTMTGHRDNPAFSAMGSGAPRQKAPGGEGSLPDPILTTRQLALSAMVGAATALAVAKVLHLFRRKRR